MKAHTFDWLMLLTLIKSFSCNFNPFRLKHSNLTATEGSCIEIQCEVSKEVTSYRYWFWIKDPVYEKGQFISTIIYSSSETKRPVNPQFVNRVKYVGSEYTKWKAATSSSPEKCSVLIQDLNKTDSGNYTFRYVGEGRYKWVIQPFTSLTVAENPCLLTFEEPKTVTENDTVTLTCHTLTSCHSKPEIKALAPLSPFSFQSNKSSKTATLRFDVTWKDDGRRFSCQTENNTDPCLIRNISLTVGYAPKDMSVTISPEAITEGQSVTFTCSAKGQPQPSFTWLKNNIELNSNSNWTIQSINESQNGSYTCKAENKHGSEKSVVIVDVKYAPDVDIEFSQEPKRTSKTIIQGDKVTFACSVKRSNPPPYSITWFKDGKCLNQNNITFKNIQPEDNGTYICTAKNTVGSISKTLELIVQYKPRKTNILIHETSVKINTTIVFTCRTDAYPKPLSYSWFHYKQTKPSQKEMLMVSKTTLNIEKVKRANEGCYVCNASNSIDKGDTSQPVCIKVLFPPNNTNLYMTEVVTEGEPVRVRCTAESFPPSSFNLTRSSTSNFQTPEWRSTLDNSSYEFNATSTDAGFYTCNAFNSEGKQWSSTKNLVVKYSPKEVKVKAHPNLIVKENESLTLDCSTNSYPSVHSVTWMKMTDGMNETSISTNTSLIVDSASVSDIGKYSCMVKNEIGTGKSEQVDVKVKYGPKFTKIEKVKEEHHEDVTKVTLTCISQCYPEAKHYLWYKRIDNKESREVLNSKDIEVRSDQPGEYYCVAINEIGKRSSEPIKLFDDTVMKIVKAFLLCLIFLILCILIFLYRRRRNNLIQRGTTNVQSWRRFLGSWNGVSRSSGNQSGLAEPFRSRDDLLPDQPCAPNAQRHQRHPDSTTASNVNTVYAAVNLPKGKQAASAQNPIKGHGGNTGHDSINYASVFFVNRKKNPEEDAEYSVVSKPKKSKVTEQESQEDYENFDKGKPPKPPYTYNFDSDTDTSEDEEEVNYTHVNFQPKSGNQRPKRDSSSSSSSSSTEDETQYSQVKI